MRDIAGDDVAAFLREENRGVAVAGGDIERGRAGAELEFGDGRLDVGGVGEDVRLAVLAGLLVELTRGAHLHRIEVAAQVARAHLGVPSFEHQAVFRQCGVAGEEEVADDAAERVVGIDRTFAGEERHLVEDHLEGLHAVVEAGDERLHVALPRIETTRAELALLVPALQAALDVVLDPLVPVRVADLEAVRLAFVLDVVKQDALQAVDLRGKKAHQRREAVDVARDVVAVGTFVVDDFVAEEVLDHGHLVVVALGELDDRRGVADVEVDEVKANARVAQQHLDGDAEGAVSVLVKAEANGRIHKN